jgi:hypothetical protein
MVRKLTRSVLDFGCVTREHQLVEFEDRSDRNGWLQDRTEPFDGNRSTESSFPVFGERGAYRSNRETVVKGRGRLE